MDYATLKLTSQVSIVLLILSPLLGSVVGAVVSGTEVQGLLGLQVFVMGMYNLPFILGAILSQALAASFNNKSKFSTANFLLIVSSCISIIGTVVMLLWVVEAA